MTASGHQGTRSAGMSLEQLKARAFDAIKQHEMWAQEVRALAAEIEAREKAVQMNAAAPKEIVDSEKAGAAS